MNKIVVLILVFSTCAVSAQDSRIHIGIYYASLCKDSTNFITKQLGLVYDYVEDYVDIFFVPFGKSESVDGGGSFICQHKEIECEGNKIQSCTLHLLNGDQRLQIVYVVCQMNPKSDKTGQNCAEEVGLDFQDVEDCLNSNLATELQLEAEIITNKINKPLTWVPTIVYNDVFNEDLQDRTIKDFLAVLCEQLKRFGNSKIPTLCTDPY